MYAIEQFQDFRVQETMASHLGWRSAHGRKATSEGTQPSPAITIPPDEEQVIGRNTSLPGTDRFTFGYSEFAFNREKASVTLDCAF
jgi:hypothetical protein